MAIGIKLYLRIEARVCLRDAEFSIGNEAACALYHTHAGNYNVIVSRAGLYFQNVTLASFVGLNADRSVGGEGDRMCSRSIVNDIVVIGVRICHGSLVLYSHVKLVKYLDVSYSVSLGVKRYHLTKSKNLEKS